MKRRFSLGVLIGAIAGIIAGIITAPKSGRETRTEIADKAKELKDRTAIKADIAREKATKVATNLKSKATKG